MGQGISPPEEPNQNDVNELHGQLEETVKKVKEESASRMEVIKQYMFMKKGVNENAEANVSCGKTCQCQD